MSRLLWERAALSGAVMTIGTLFLFRWELDGGASLERAQTVALTTLVLFQAFHLGSSRSERMSVFRKSVWSNPFLLVSTAGALALHVAALYSPVGQTLLRVVPLEIEAWPAMVAVSLSVVLVVELHKALRR